jgi:hypothetical protein
MNSGYLCDALLAHPEHYHVVAAHMGDLRRAAQRLTEAASSPTMVESEQWRFQ